MGLGSILGAIGGLVAAPFTGGASMIPVLTGVGSTIGGGIDALTNSGAASNLSTVLGSAAGGALNQKTQSDLIKLALGNQGLSRQQFATAAPATRLSTGSKAALAAALSKAGPVKVNWGGPGSGLRGQIPTYSGGFSDALASLKNDPTYQSLLDLVGKDELKQQQSGGATGGNQDAATPSFLNGVGDPSTTGNILGGAGLATGILGALGKSGIFGKGDQSGIVPGDITDGIPINPEDPGMTDWWTQMPGYSAG